MLEQFMEPAWIRYLRETRPDLYAQMQSERAHDIKWRDDEIKRFQLCNEKRIEELNSIVAEEGRRQSSAVESLWKIFRRDNMGMRHNVAIEEFVKMLMNDLKYPSTSG